MLSKKAKRILIHIGKYGVGVSSRPYAEIAECLGLSEKDVVQTLSLLQKDGIVREIRGVINHRKAGYTVNALIAWRIEAKYIDVITKYFVSHALVSHCYERELSELFPFNVFVMMHANEKKTIDDFVRRIWQQYKVDYEVLFTDKELKKTKIDLEVFLCDTG